MKFKFLTLLFGCVCMCFSPFLVGVACAENPSNNVSPSAVDSDNANLNKIQSKHSDKEKKDKNSKKSSVGKKIVKAIRKVKTELIVGTVTAIAIPIILNKIKFTIVSIGGISSYKIASNVCGLGNCISGITAAGCLVSAVVKLLA